MQAFHLVISLQGGRSGTCLVCRSLKSRLLQRMSGWTSYTCYQVPTTTKSEELWTFVEHYYITVPYEATLFLWCIYLFEPFGEWKGTYRTSI